MTTGFKIVLLAMTGFVICYNLYFVVVALLGLARRRKEAPHVQPATRFVCVVAARNEERVIGHLVDSLYAQKYPQQLFRVLVAPNNCTDDTAGEAARHGAELFFPRGTVRGKGEVLTQVTDALLKAGEFDAMCVFDADNLVDPQFLAHMNDAVQNGAYAAQGCRDSKNPRQTPISGSCSIGFWLLNRFYNQCRSALGLSALINGSGFAVTREALQRLGGWHTSTMTEDYEFSAQCACAGMRVAYVAGAQFYDEQPATFGQSWCQRRRWTTGSLQSFQQYHGALFARALRGSLVCADMYLTFLMPVMQLAGLAVAALGTGALLTQGTVVLGRFVLRSVWVALGLTALGVVGSLIGAAAAALCVVLLQKMPVQSMVGGICTFWLYLVSSAALTLLSFVRQETSWKAIEHTACISLDEVKKA